jgi:hypothetical protein
LQQSHDLMMSHTLLTVAAVAIAAIVAIGDRCAFGDQFDTAHQIDRLEGTIVPKRTRDTTGGSEAMESLWGAVKSVGKWCYRHRAGILGAAAVGTGVYVAYRYVQEYAAQHREELPAFEIRRSTAVLYVFVAALHSVCSSREGGECVGG